MDKLGLDNGDRAILTTIIQKFAGGPVGVETLAAAISVRMLEHSKKYMTIFDSEMDSISTDSKRTGCNRTSNGTSKNGTSQVTPLIAGTGKGYD